MAFIHENLLFSDWWHTDQLIRYVEDLDFDTSWVDCGVVSLLFSPLLALDILLLFVSIFYDFVWLH